MRSVSNYNSLLKINKLISNYPIISRSINMSRQNMYVGDTLMCNVYGAKQMRYDTLLGTSCLVTDPAIKLKVVKCAFLHGDQMVTISIQLIFFLISFDNSTVDAPLRA